MGALAELDLSELDALVPKPGKLDLSGLDDLVPKETPLDFSGLDAITPAGPAQRGFQADVRKADIAGGSRTRMERERGAFLGIAQPYVLDPLASGLESSKRNSALMELISSADTLDWMGQVDRGEIGRIVKETKGRALPGRQLDYHGMNAERRAAVKASETAKLLEGMRVIAEQTKKLAAMPRDPEIAHALDENTPAEEAWEVFKRKPLLMLSSISFESLAMMIQTYGATAVAGIAAGPLAAAATMGLGSGRVDFAASTLEALVRRGVNIADEKEIRRAMDDGLLEQAKEIGLRHSLPVALGDATIMGSMFLKLGRGFVTNALEKAGIDILGSGAFEAAGQKAAGEGESITQVVAEMGAELTGLPAKAGLAGVTGMTRQATAAERADLGAQLAAVDLLRPENAQLRAVEAKPAAVQQPAAAQQGPWMPGAVMGPSPIEVQPAGTVRAGGVVAPRAAQAAAPIPEPQAPEVAPQAAVEAPAAAVPPEEGEKPPEAFATRQAAKRARRMMESEFKARFRVVEHPIWRGMYAVVPYERTEAELQADEAARKRAIARGQVDLNDPMTTTVAKLGGIAGKAAMDVFGDDKPTWAPHARFRVLVRKEGGLELDDLREKLTELGFLLPDQDINDMAEMLQDELAGRRKHFSVWATSPKEEPSEEEVLQGEAADDAERLGVEDLEATIPATERDELKNFVPASEAEMTGAKLITVELFAKLGELDPAKAERRALQSEGMDYDALIQALQGDINESQQAVGVGRGEVAGAAAEPLALAGQTEAERAADEAAAGDRERAEQEAADRADLKRRADEVARAPAAGDQELPAAPLVWTQSPQFEGTWTAPGFEIERTDEAEFTLFSKRGTERRALLRFDSLQEAQEAAQRRVDARYALGRRATAENGVVTIRLTRAERGYFGQIFASPADRAELLESVPSARFDMENLTLSESEMGALADYADQTVALERGEGNERLPPSFYQTTFPPRPGFALGRQFSPEFVAANERIVPELQALAQRIAPGVNVNFAASLTATGPGAERSGGVEDSPAAGLFWASRNLMDVALSYRDPEQTVRHESLHFLRANKFFTDAEWRMLEKESQAKWMARYGVPDAEEGIAYAFGDYRAGRLQAAPAIQRIFRKIADFLQRLGNLLRGNGFNSVESIFARAESGEIGARGPAGGPWTTPDGRKYAIGTSLTPQPPPENRRQYVARAMRELGDQMQQGGTRFVWEGTVSQLKFLLTTPRTIAAFDADFTPVYQVAVQQWQYRDSLIAEFEGMTEAYSRASKADKAVVNRVLEHDRLSGQVSLAGQNMTVSFTDSRAQLSRPGDRVTVTDAQKTAYWSIRKMLDRALDLFRDQTLEDFGLPPGLTSAQVLERAQNAPSPREAKRLQNVAEVMQGIEQARRRGYVPFTRFGEMAIIVKDASGQVVERKHIEVGFLDRKRAVPKAVAIAYADLRKKYGAGFIVSQPFQVIQTGPQQSINMEGLDLLAQMGNIDNATWDTVRAKLERAVHAQGFRQHFFRAREIAGYSTDFERSLAAYTVGISGYLARRKYAKGWIDALAKIPGQKVLLRRYAERYKVYVNTPTEEFALLRSINFVAYLTSPAAWIINATQPWIVSVPWASQFTSYPAANAAFLRATGEALAMFRPNRGFQMFKAEAAPADVRDALREAFLSGVLLPLTTYEAMGVAQGRHQWKGNLSKAGRTAVEIFGYGFTGVERLNRIATFIALYRLARDDPKLAGNFARIMADNALAKPLISFDKLGRAELDPAAFAEYGVDDTHFRTGKVNRATIMRGPGTLIFQFKPFLLNMLERLVTMMAKQGSEGRAAALLVLAYIYALAGIWGLPGAEDLRGVYEALMKLIKDKNVNADLQVRAIIVEITGSIELAEFNSGGIGGLLPDAIAVALSKRIGIGKILPHSPGEALGVSYDLWWKRQVQAMEHFEVDNMLLGLAEFFPIKAVGDIITQFAWSLEGIRTKARDKPVIPPEQVTPAMRVQKALGFTPAAVSRIREAERAEKTVQTVVDEIRSDFYARTAKAEAAIIRAEDKGDIIEIAKAEAKLEALEAEREKWNEEHPDHEQIKLDIRTRRANLAKEFEGSDYDKGVRRQARDEVQRIRRLYGRP